MKFIWGEVNSLHGKEKTATIKPNFDMDPVQARSYRFELEQIVEVPVPPILEEIAVVMDVPVLQIQEGVVVVIQFTVVPMPQVLDVPILQIQEGVVVPMPEQTVDVPTPQTMEETVEVVRLTPLDQCSKRTCEHVEPLQDETEKWQAVFDVESEKDSNDVKGCESELLMGSIFGSEALHREPD